MDVDLLGNYVLTCDVFELFSKAWTLALAQVVGRFGEVGPRSESVGMFVQCWFLGTGVLSDQFCHTCSITLGGFRTQCLARKSLFRTHVSIGLPRTMAHP